MGIIAASNIADIKERNKIMFEMRRAGYTTPDIAKFLGMSQETVRRICNRNKVFKRVIHKDEPPERPKVRVINSYGQQFVS